MALLAAVGKLPTDDNTSRNLRFASANARHCERFSAE
jgi:hypothetical protein